MTVVDNDTSFVTVDVVVSVIGGSEMDFVSVLVVSGAAAAAADDDDDAGSDPLPSTGTTEYGTRLRFSRLRGGRGARGHEWASKMKIAAQAAKANLICMVFLP